MPGEEALEAARAQDKPILLSIGYSACHWCHVMAHESFEDDEVAALMNLGFHQHQGRPGTAFRPGPDLPAGAPDDEPAPRRLAADHVPHARAGTRFSAARTSRNPPRYGLPGFAELLPRVAQFYRTERAQITRQGEAIVGGFERMQPANPGVTTPSSPAPPVDLALENLAAGYDARFGGFGAAPKFPRPTDLDVSRGTMPRAGPRI